MERIIACTLAATLLVAGPAFAEDVVENTPQLCQNGEDDDADGLTDCDDDGCAQLIFCVGHERTEETAAECGNSEDDDGDGAVDCEDESCAEACSRSITVDGQLGTRGVYQPRVVERGPEVEYVEHADPRRYPLAWASRPMTYREGMLVPEMALVVQPITSFFGYRDEFLVRLGLGLTYAIFDFWDITLVPVPLRLAPVFDIENPAVATTVRFLDYESFELGLYANVGIPIGRSTASDFPETTPLATLVSRSRYYDVAHLEVGLRARIRIADLLRIDLQVPTVAIIFSSNTLGELSPRADLSFLADIGVAITEYAYVGIWTGAFLQGPGYDAGRIPFGFFAGGVIPGSRRGPAADIGVRVGWPIFFDGGARPGVDPVDPGFWQLSFDVRVFTYLLP